MAYYATYQQDETGALQKVVINAGVGFVLPYYGETAPPGTLACDGSEISRTVYDELFAVLGTKAGAGDGSTTFNLPDLRGQFVRGTGGNAAALGVQQGDATRDIASTTEIRSWWDGSDWGTMLTKSTGAFYTDTGTEDATGVPSVMLASSPPDPTYKTTQKLYFVPSRVVPVAVENRPVNIALLWCIIYE